MVAANLIYFPEIYPDELVYSIVARFQHHMIHLSASNANRLLFGKPVHSIVHSLPNGLGALANAAAGSDRSVSAQILLQKHTLFPYLSAFARRSARERSAAAMLGTGEARPSAAAHLGINRVQDVAIPHLRFCLECSSEQIRDKGEPYWVRQHQISAAPVCQEHGTILRASQVPKSARKPHLLASIGGLASCRPVLDIDGRDLEAAQELTGIAVQVLAGDRLGLDPENLRFSYYELLEKKGLKDGKIADGLALRRLFDQMIRPFIKLFPTLLRPDGTAGEWLDNFFEKKTPINPVCHILLHYVLRNTPDVQTYSPNRDGFFGPRLARCLNPAADHFNEATMKRHAWTKQPSKGRRSFNRYTCHCGFQYRMQRTSDMTLGRPYVERLGPELGRHIESLIARGCSAEEAAAAAGLRLSALLRLLEVECISHPWPTMAERRAAKKIVSVSTPHKPSVAEQNRIRQQAIRDQADERWAPIARSAIEQMLAEQPEVRITREAIRRKMGLTYTRHLPNTERIIADAAETDAQFLERRARNLVQSWRDADERPSPAIVRDIAADWRRRKARVRQLLELAGWRF